MKRKGRVLSEDNSQIAKANAYSCRVNKQVEGCDCYPELRRRIAELDKEVAYLKAENEILTSTGQGCWL